MTYGLDYAKLDFRVSLRRDLDTLRVDVTIASHAGIN